MIKYHVPGKYSTYKEIPLNMIDPTNECHRIETVTKNIVSVKEKIDDPEINLEEVDNDGFMTVRKRKLSFTPPKQKKYRFISPVKLNQVIFEYVNGTRTEADIIEELIIDDEDEETEDLGAVSDKA